MKILKTSISVLAVMMLISCAGTKDTKTAHSDTELRLTAMDTALKETQEDIKRLSNEVDILGTIVSDLSEIVLKKPTEPAQNAAIAPIENFAAIGNGTVIKTRAGFEGGRTRLVLEFARGAKIEYQASAKSDTAMQIVLPGIQWTAPMNWTARDTRHIRAYNVETLDDRTILHIETSGNPLSVRVSEIDNPPRLVLDFN